MAHPDDELNQTFLPTMTRFERNSLGVVVGILIL